MVNGVNVRKLNNSNSPATSLNPLDSPRGNGMGKNGFSIPRGNYNKNNFETVDP